jgi:hypothetical protein
VKVTIPTTATTGTSAKLRLTVTSKQNPSNLTGATGDIAVTVGSAPPPAQDRVIVTFQSTAGGTVRDGTVIVPTSDSLIAVTFKVTIKDPGTYTVATPTIQSNPNSLWRAQLMGSATITTTTANATSTVQIGLAAKPGAGQTNLIVRVSSASNSTIFGECSQPIKI